MREQLVQGSPGHRRRPDRPAGRLPMRATPGLVLLLACTGRPAQPPSPVLPVQVTVARAEEPSDSGAPRVAAAGRYIVVRGVARSPAGSSLYGDVDLSAPPLLRLTLYDSVPGRPVEAVGPSADRAPVRYEARVGPVPRGEYQVTVGKFQPGSRLIVVESLPERVVVKGDGR